MGDIPLKVIMPLIKSLSKKAVQQNTAELIASGRPAEQAYAIAKMYKEMLGSLRSLLVLNRNQLAAC